jgi:DNA-binding Lrp family transcriptional regulator
MVKMDLRREILDILLDDASVSEDTIAKMIGEEEGKVHEEIAKLKEEGIIVKIGAIVNSEAMGEHAPAEAMIEIKVEPKLDFGYEDIARRIYQFQEVKALYLMSGRYDFSIRVEAKTMKEIFNFVWEKLAVLEGVRSTETLFIMKKYKENGTVLIKTENNDRLVVTP